MDMDFLETQMFKEIAQEMADNFVANIVAMIVPERWISRKAYAKYYGISKSTIHNYAHFLRKNGAISGKGKAMRYDKFFNPITNEYTIPEGTQTI